jgi:hypothetical protein
MNPNKLDTLCATRSRGTVCTGKKTEGLSATVVLFYDATASIVPRDDCQVGKVVPVLG